MADIYHWYVPVKSHFILNLSIPTIKELTLEFSQLLLPDLVVVATLDGGGGLITQIFLVYSIQPGI